METTYCDANDKEKKQKIKCFTAFIKATPTNTNISIEPTLTLKKCKIYFNIIWIDTNFKTIEGYGSFDFDTVKKWLDTEFEIIDINSIKDNTKIIQKFVNDLTDKLNAIINTSDYKTNVEMDKDGYPIGLTFESMFNLLLEGYACARRCWKCDNYIAIIKEHYKDLDESGKVVTKEKKVIQIKENGHYKDWKPSQEDLYSRDWYACFHYDNLL